VNDPDLLRLVEVATRLGSVPADPLVATSTVDGDADTACSLCGLPLGQERAFELRSARATTVLHRRCYSAWVEVVVAPRCRGLRG
jgi:hypothetical protein